MEDSSKGQSSVVTAFYLINGKKIDASRGVSEYRSKGGTIMGYFVRTADKVVQTINAASVVAVEVTYDSVEEVDAVFRRDS
jgi:hypothetical protein